MTSINNLYRASPRKIRRFTERCFFAGLVPFVQSSPGMGKSSIMRQIAKDLQLQMIDHRLSTSEPTDLSGLPQFVNGKARFAPFEELFPIEDTEVPEGKQGWLIFLDEFNSASKQVQAASYKLVLDRMVGQYRLHPQVVIAMAGNLSTDRAITNQISTAMQSRVVHLEMEISHQEWLEDVALKENYDSRIIAYLSQYPNKLMDFNPSHNEKTFCAPRTWSFMNSLIQSEQELRDEDIALYAGTITSGVAADFVQFTKIYKTLISIQQILSDPSGSIVPEDLSTKWAIITKMAEHVSPDNFGKLTEYANRFDLSFRILFFRSVMVRQPDLWSHPAYAKAMIELSRYLTPPSN